MQNSNFFGKMRKDGIKKRYEIAVIKDQETGCEEIRSKSFRVC